MSSELRELLEKHIFWLISRKREKLLDKTSDRIEKFIERHGGEERVGRLTEQYFTSVKEPSLIGWERYVEMRQAQ